MTNWVYSYIIYPLHLADISNVTLTCRACDTGADRVSCLIKCLLPWTNVVKLLSCFATLWRGMTMRRNDIVCYHSLTRDGEIVKIPWPSGWSLVSFKVIKMWPYCLLILQTTTCSCGLVRTWVYLWTTFLTTLKVCFCYLQMTLSR